LPEIDNTGKVAPPALFWVLLGLQLVAMFAVYPYAIGSLKKLHVNHSQYGTAPFLIDVGIGTFYKIYLLTLLVAFGVIFVIGIVAAILGAAGAATGATGGVIVVILLGIAFSLGYFVIGAIVLAYTKSRIGNLVFNTTRLNEEVSFASTLKLRKLAWIYFVNMFAILLSLGLAVPWAVIRVMRYRAECLTLQSTASLDEFISGVSAHVSATGEELGEFFNIDLSL
jgi:uncharacterized membrane protein YjgN (DUF898 family)